MFVKVIHNNSVGHQVNLYECDRVSHREVTDPSDVKNISLVVEMENNSPDGGIGLWFGIVDDTSIYFMNNDGRTVDSLHWKNGSYQ
jgi:hypothetical protein